MGKTTREERDREFVNGEVLQGEYVERRTESEK